MVLSPKIWCKVCHARLEINDPGCKRDDCKIRLAKRDFKYDSETNLFVPVEMGRRNHRWKKPEKLPKFVVLEQGTPPPRDDEVVTVWNNGEPVAGITADQFNSYMCGVQGVY